MTPHALSGTSATALLPTVPQDTRRLIRAVIDLSAARDIEQIRSIVRTAAREMVSADGATFVLREGDLCHYVDEDAIGPLWKGQRFPLSACISGWTMLNRRPASVPDIFVDPRTPVDAYRPTFVKSLVMVPIREADPIGAIGTYWATPHDAAPRTVELLQALANTTAVAIENVRVHQELDSACARGRRNWLPRTRSSTRFRIPCHTTSAHHCVTSAASRRCFDSRADSGLSHEARHSVERIISSADRMSQLIDDLLAFARLGRTPLHTVPVDLGVLIGEARSEALHDAGDRVIEWSLSEASLVVPADAGLLKQVMVNLLSNAVKYTRHRTPARIEVGVQAKAQAGGEVLVFVRDNGAGLDPRYADKLFGVFQRLHSNDEFEGTGVGLANVRRIIKRHGGRTWAEGAPNEGATFWFTLPTHPGETSTGQPIA